jgi:hypothetical protein
MNIKLGASNVKASHHWCSKEHYGNRAKTMPHYPQLGARWFFLSFVGTQFNI